MIKRVTYSSLNPGPHLVVLGAVHGNEPAGPQAIKPYIKAFENDEIELKCGQVTFVPVVNEKAKELGKRFVERNLNRSLYRKETPQAHEDFIDPILCGILDEADALLDIHSYQSEGGPFAFLGTSSAKELDFSRNLGIQHYVYGWSDAFGNNEDVDEFHSMGTTEYVRYKGSFPAFKDGSLYTKNKAGLAITFECGNHNNEDNAEVAGKVINNALVYFDLVDGSFKPLSTQAKEYCIKMQTVFLKEREGQLVKNWKNCDPVSKGEIIAKYDDGDEITAPDDGFIILPKTQTDHALNTEWFYFGVQTDFPLPNK